MLRIIILRELLDIVASKKNLICMSIVIFLTVASTLLNINDYRLRQQEYLTAINISKDIIRPQHVLSVLIQGKDASLGNVLVANSIDSKPKGYLGSDSKQTNTQTEIPFDLDFIVKYLFSLIVIFLAYNIVSEDKERGTLRLSLSFNVSKNTILAGKCISHGTVIFSSTLIAFTISILLMMGNSSIQLTGHDLIRIGLLFIISNLYLFLFLILAIWISTTVSNNKSSLMVLLQIWIIIVYLIPGLGGIIAEHARYVPSQLEQQRKTEELTYPLEKEAIKIRRSIRPDATDYEKQLAQNKSDEIFSKIIKIQLKSEREFSNQLTSQAELGFTITQFSPAVLLERMATHIALTDIDEYDHFVDSAMQYQSEVFETRKAPHFALRPTPITKSIGDSLASLLIMILECLALYVLAHVAFLRKDVR